MCAFRYGKYKTLAMIKPYTANVYYDDIKSIIVAHGFEIISEVHQKMSVEKAGEFYMEHEGKDFYTGLVSAGAS